MISVSDEIYSKMVFESYEVSHVTTELICLYSDHQFAKLSRMKCIVGYLLVDVSKPPSRTSRTRHTENRNEICRGLNNQKKITPVLL